LVGYILNLNITARIRSVCTGVVVIETHESNHIKNYPAPLFYWDNVFRSHTNWAGPSEGAVAAWLRSAGFVHIYSNKPDTQRPESRQIFIGCIKEMWRNEYSDNSHLKYFDRHYFNALRRNTQKLLGEKDMDFDNLGNNTSERLNVYESAL